MMERSPYIGVTGYMNQSEVIRSLASFPHPSRGVKHKLMVGVLASSKTIAGQPNKWSGRFPKAGDIAGIFFRDPLALNLVHYSTDDKTSSSFRDQLEHVWKIGGENINGIQLNVAWPSVSAIQDFRAKHQEAILVLQVGTRAMEVHGYDPLRIAFWVSHYTELVDYILIDPSGGLGKPFSSEVAIEMLGTIEKENGSTVNLGIAGGLGADCLLHLIPVVEQFPMVSIDAEGQLRTPQPEDKLEMWKVSEYLTRTIKLFYPSVETD